MRIGLNSPALSWGVDRNSSYEAEKLLELVHRWKDGTQLSTAVRERKQVGVPKLFKRLFQANSYGIKVCIELHFVQAGSSLDDILPHFPTQKKKKMVEG